MSKITSPNPVSPPPSSPIPPPIPPISSTRQALFAELNLSPFESSSWHNFIELHANNLLHDLALRFGIKTDGVTRDVLGNLLIRFLIDNDRARGMTRVMTQGMGQTTTQGATQGMRQGMGQGMGQGTTQGVEQEVTQGTAHQKGGHQKGRELGHDLGHDPKDDPTDSKDAARYLILAEYPNGVRFILSRQGNTNNLSEAISIAEQVARFQVWEDVWIVDRQVGDKNFAQMNIKFLGSLVSPERRRWKSWPRG